MWDNLIKAMKSPLFKKLLKPHLTLIVQYPLEIAKDVSGINEGYTDSFPFYAFNRDPVVGDIFFVNGRTSSEFGHLSFNMTAKVTEVKTQENTKFAVFSAIEVVPTVFARTAEEATHATTADSATNATNASHATNADKATKADKAEKDINGNAISSTYAKRTDIVNGNVRAGYAKYAENAQNAEMADRSFADNSGNKFAETYAQKFDGTIKIGSVLTLATTSVSMWRVGDLIASGTWGIKCTGDAVNLVYARLQSEVTDIITVNKSARICGYIGEDYDTQGKVTMYVYLIQVQ